MLSIDLLADTYESLLRIKIDEKNNIHLFLKNINYSVAVEEIHTLKNFTEIVKTRTKKKFFKAIRKGDVTIEELIRAKNNLEDKLKRKTYVYINHDSTFIEIGYIDGKDEIATLTFDTPKIFKKFYN